MSSTPSAQQPRVGTAAIIFNAKNPSQFLIGKRTSKSHGTDTWQLPGGHLDFKEEIEEGAAREVKEETDLDVKALGVVATTNDIFENEDPSQVKHYITLFVACDMLEADAVPRITEPDKCAEWRWETWEGLKRRQEDGEALFLPLQHLLSRKSGLDQLRRP
ncbi:unnamed protein product, partial [Clonostachys solani]